MPISGKPISDQLKRAIAQQKESAKRVRKLRQAQAEFDRQLLAELGQNTLNSIARWPVERLAAYRRNYLNTESPERSAPFNDQKKLDRLRELLAEAVRTKDLEAKAKKDAD